MKYIFFILSAFVLLVTGQTAFAQSGNSSSTSLRKTHFWLSKSGLALDGYDPVSYFRGKPQKGSSAQQLNHNGVVYWFASADTKAEFQKNPEKYEPAYGGWCAYAIGAKGEKVEPDPTNFKIVQGKVNLFYRNFFSNTLDDWNENEKSLKAKAEQNWLTKIFQ